MNDFRDRLQIACARCTNLGKPQITDPTSGDSFRCDYVKLAIPDGWEWVSDKVVCEWCALAFRELQRKFMSGA